jgi:hypothetical protein
MLVPAVIAGALACGRSSPPAIEHVPLGTWGGDDAGLIVAEESAHAHVGCTLGDVAGPLTLDDKGRFDIDGTYNVDAFPIDLGIRHPARFSGETDGRRLTFSVRLTDTGQTFSSGTLVLGRAPQMRNCPICRR